MEPMASGGNDKRIQLGAQAVSYVLHPLMLCTYLALMLGTFMPRFLVIPPAALYKFAALVFVMTFVLPAANLLLFRSAGTLTSLQMATRAERRLPFILITLIYIAVTAMFFYKVSVNVNFNKIMLIVTAMVLMTTLFTFFQKISVHSLAMAGGVGILLPLNKVMVDGSMVWPTAGLIVLSGLVMSSRLYLNAHTLREVFTGATVGFTVGFFGMILLF
jgi:membrane-associated phospholipid phosphatase